MFSLKKLLEDMGHKVIVFSMNHPLNFQSEYSRYFVDYINYDEAVKSISLATGFEVLSRAVFSIDAKRKMEELIEDERPDIAHLQNIHHHITPSIFYPLKKNNIPIVWTLHDFVLICPNTSFLANGRICERCKKVKYFWPPLIRCKKNSVLASLMAGFETALHRLMRVNDLVDIFITPSEFLRNKLIEYGFDEKRIICLNNFNNIEITSNNSYDGGYYLYIGRLSHEKGIKTLIDASMKANIGKLKIVGEGPLKDEMVSYVKRRGGNISIEFLGHKSHDDVIELLKGSRFLVLPSECYENFPYSVIEAFACGKPVIASRLGGIPELVKNWQTGLLFKPGDLENLALKIRFFMKHPEKARKMGENAKEFVNNKLAKDIYYERLIKIYEELI